MSDSGSSSSERGRRTDQDPRLAAEALSKARVIEAAIARAVRQALRQHKRAGNPVVVWREGKVVWVPPEEIEVPDDPA